MKAAVTTAREVIEVIDVDDPAVGVGQVRVAVELVGLCGSDLHIFEATHPFVRYPQVQGHEFVGIVESVGLHVHDAPAIGSRVVVEPTRSCGACLPCAAGRPNACSNLQVYGVHLPGALAELIVVDAPCVHPVPDLSPYLAVGVEPLTIGLWALQRGGVVAGDSVLVVGAGSIGRAVTVSAVDAGAHVALADRGRERLSIAAGLGAEWTINTSLTGLSIGPEVFGGVAPRVVIDTTGAPEMIRAAAATVRPTGTVVIVGISDQEVALPVTVFTQRELDVRGSRNSIGLFPAAIDLARRHAAPLLGVETNVFDLDDVASAFENAQTHPERLAKTLVRVTPDRQ